MNDEADPLQLSMIGINPSTALSLAEPIRFPDARRLDIGQPSGNAAMVQYVLGAREGFRGSRR